MTLNLFNLVFFASFTVLKTYICTRDATSEGHFGLPWEDYQHVVVNEFMCMVAGCALRTDVYHWMFGNRSTWFKVNKMALQIEQLLVNRINSPLLKMCVALKRRYLSKKCFCM